MVELLARSRGFKRNCKEDLALPFGLAASGDKMTRSGRGYFVSNFPRVSASKFVPAANNGRLSSSSFMLQENCEVRALFSSAQNIQRSDSRVKISGTTRRNCDVENQLISEKEKFEGSDLPSKMIHGTFDHSSLLAERKGLSHDSGKENLKIYLSDRNSRLGPNNVHPTGKKIIASRNLSKKKVEIDGKKTEQYRKKDMHDRGSKAKDSNPIIILQRPQTKEEAAMNLAKFLDVPLSEVCRKYHNSSSLGMLENDAQDCDDSVTEHSVTKVCEHDIEEKSDSTAFDGLRNEVKLQNEDVYPDQKKVALSTDAESVPSYAGIFGVEGFSGAILSPPSTWQEDGVCNNDGSCGNCRLAKSAQNGEIYESCFTTSIIQLPTNEGKLHCFRDSSSISSICAPRRGTPVQPAIVMHPGSHVLTTAGYDSSLLCPYSETWAGPAFSNSPPPSSLPLPSFPSQQCKPVWAREVRHRASCSQTYRDTCYATNDLKRILNLDMI